MLDALKTDPVAFSIGEFDIFWYGIIITIGIAIGAFWGMREIEKRGQSVDDFFNGLLIAVLSGYLFARLTYVLLDVIENGTARYDTFLDVINLRAGGANILGGFIGATLVTLLYVRYRKMKIWHYADVAGPALLIAQGIGRWGNFINQELYGPPTELPWGISIDQPYRMSEFAALPPDTLFHPTFLYESIWLILGFFVLITLNNRNRNRWAPGTLFGFFMLWWGGGRFFIEFFRPDQATVGETPITYSMLLSIAFALVGLYIVRGRSSSGKKRRPIKPKPQRG